MHAPGDPYPGHDLVARGFPAAATDGLAAAVHGCGGAAGPVGVLAGALRPGRWVESRAAVAGLRRQGAAAVGAIPALAAWTMLQAVPATEPAEQLTVNEALLTLRELRRALMATRRERPDDALLRLAAMQEEVVDPHLVALMTLPPRLWHRGAIAFLRDARPRPDRRLVALEGWLTRSAAPPPGDAAWWEHTRAEALTALSELATDDGKVRDGATPAVDLDALERLWQAPPFTEDPGLPPTGDA